MGTIWLHWRQMTSAKAALLDAKRYEAAAAQALLAIPETERGTVSGRAAVAERRNAAVKVAAAQKAVDDLAERSRSASFAAHSAREKSAEAWGVEQNALAALEAFLHTPPPTGG